VCLLVCPSHRSPATVDRLTLVKEPVIHIFIEEDLEIAISSGEVPLSRRDPNPPSSSPHTNALKCSELGQLGKAYCGNDCVRISEKIVYISSSNMFAKCAFGGAACKSA
jgi:hypothetical protein